MQRETKTTTTMTPNVLRSFMKAAKMDVFDRALICIRSHCDPSLFDFCNCFLRELRSLKSSLLCDNYVCKVP